MSDIEDRCRRLAQQADQIIRQQSYRVDRLYARHLTGESECRLPIIKPSTTKSEDLSGKAKQSDTSGKRSD
jgi:hypothetical protein